MDNCRSSLYCAAYERSGTASRSYPRHYYRNTASGKTIVQRDIENRHRASLFDICCLYIFHRDERAGCRFVSPRPGARVRNNHFDLHRDWERNPQSERQAQKARLSHHSRERVGQESLGLAMTAGSEFCRLLLEAAFPAAWSPILPGGAQSISDYLVPNNFQIRTHAMSVGI